MEPRENTPFDLNYLATEESGEWRRAKDMEARKEARRAEARERSKRERDISMKLWKYDMQQNSIVFYHNCRRETSGDLRIKVFLF